MCSILALHIYFHDPCCISKTNFLHSVYLFVSFNTSISSLYNWVSIFFSCALLRQICMKYYLAEYHIYLYRRICLLVNSNFFFHCKIILNIYFIIPVLFLFRTFLPLLIELFLFSRYLFRNIILLCL